MRVGIDALAVGGEEGVAEVGSVGREVSRGVEEGNGRI